MTKINKIIIHGFKSFAKRTEIDFGEKFNVVLGPNGSGKSNVLDALCFVLGKSSAKALRTEKSANLIYNGGKSKTPAKHAEVSIFFDNSKKIFPTEEEEIKITRIVKHNGISLYKINDKPRTRQQILELLSLAKINPNGYNIILQGDIIRFVEMPPEERRLLVEDIAGISVYENKKQKAISELAKVEEKLKESGIVMKERDTHIKELKNEKEQAEKYTELDKKIKVNKASIIHLKLSKKTSEKGEFSDKLDKTKKQLEAKQAVIDKSKEKIKSLKEEIQAINREVEQKGEKEQVGVYKEVEKLKVDIASSNNRTESVKNEINKIIQRKEQLEQNVKEIEDKISKLENEKNEFKKQLKSRENERDMLVKRIDEFKKKNKLDSIGGIEKEVDALDKEAEIKQKEIMELRQKQQELLREKDKFEFQIQSTDEKINKVLEVEKENAEQIKVFKQKKEEFKKCTAELSKLINDDTSLGAQLSTAKGKLAADQEKLAKLNARNISIQELLGADTGLREILSQKSKIPGIHGTVSELGQVESKYSLALEIAAGNKIKSVVVDDDKVAARCIKHLKENRLGIATFLPMNKMRGPEKIANESEYTKANGVHGLAIDLIQFKPKYKNVFSYVFGNTLVVDTIDVARRIGVGKIKMVSLDGDASELSGAMIGGYRPKKSGLGFQEKELSVDLEKCEKQVQDAELLISRLEKERKGNEEKIAKLREFKANLEGDIIKLEKTLNIDTADLEASRKIKKEFEQGIIKLGKDIVSVQDLITKQNKELADNRIKRQDFRNKITELRNPSLVAELNAFEEKRKEVVEQILKKESEVSNIDSQIDNILKPEVENIRKIVKQHQKEEQDFRAEIKNIEKLICEMKLDLKQKEEKQRQFHEQFKELFNRRGKIDETIKKEEFVLDDMGEQSRKVELAINTLSLELARTNAEIAGIEHEFKEFEGVEVLTEKSEGDLKRELGNFENTIRKIGNVNMKALEVYDLLEKEFSELLNKKERLILEKEDVLMMMNEIETKKKELFMKSFDVLNDNFKMIFSALTTKGEASLDLENPESPFEGGVLVKVKLTGNRFMDIRSLSGGEKTLTALAFIFSIQEHEPASFYILDEVDAALDKHNSERLAQLVRKYTDNAQYVVISHNDSVISEGDRLYGVSMDEHGMSKITSIKL